MFLFQNYAVYSFKLQNIHLQLYKSSDYANCSFTIAAGQRVKFPRRNMEKESFESDKNKGKHERFESSKTEMAGLKFEHKNGTFYSLHFKLLFERKISKQNIYKEPY